MAAVLSDFASDTSRFHHHNMVAGPGQHQSSAEYRQRSRSRTGHRHARSPNPPQTSTVQDTPPTSTNSRAITTDQDAERHSSARAPLPSPPSSSSPNHAQYPRSSTSSSQKGFPGSSIQSSRQPQQEPDDPKFKAAASLTSPPTNSTLITRAAKSLDDVKNYGGNTIKVRDLAHIQDFASEEFLSYRGQSGRRRTANEPALKYEISGMPITDIIEMVAGLLTKITTTNDRQHENLHRPIPPAGETSNLTGLSSSVLAFHGKNVPTITILSYLSRIHKYCPTTYEVFLSLLVYFDRMTERVNAAPLQSLRQDQDMDQDSRPSTSYSASGSELADSPPMGSRSVPESTADLEKAQYGHPPKEPDLGAFPLSHFFVVDSFNIHRLVIAGVTCASKFFSDVFYTNSRYAKVGGLPLAELNHLELQFLLLNDFRLSVPVEELEAYGTMLVEFYAREVIANREAGNMPQDMAYQDEH
ncbi:cyclin-domain-containing protein [Bisporella sp. PMI_857]|nr:cyclin-domain-containing protein [Bisporella sp. PMI_857]